MTDEMNSLAAGSFAVQNSSKYIDPLSDFGFKRLFFGSGPNKEILIDFLNSLFEGEKEIADLEYSPAEYSGDAEELKKVFFDLMCTGKNQEQFIIEMQRAGQHYFRDRAVFYTSRLINEQLPKGRTNWNAGLKEVYLIGILEFIFKDSQPERYLHNIALTNTDTGDIFYHKLGYKFLELPKFVKTETELVTERDKWIYLLKHLSHLKKIPAVFNKRIFQKVFKIAEVSKLTKEEKNMYDSSLKARWDYENTIAYAEDIALEKGVEIGVKKGREEGREEGKHKNALETAIKMKKDGFSIEQVIKYTRLSVQEIEKL